MTIFFYGPNTYELRRQLQEMTRAYLSKAGSDFGLERLDGAAVKAGELTAALMASPFLANSRLVIVEGLALNKAISDKLPKIMETVPKSTVVVFADREVDQRTSVFRQLAKADKVVKFEPLSGPKLLGWAKTEVEALGGTAEPAVLRELVEAAGEDQWRLSGEINKLVNFDTQVTSQSIRELVMPSVEQSIFELVEAMADGKTGAALAGYRRLLGRRESEIYILTMIQWQLRNLLLAKTAPPTMSPAELAKVVGMSPYVAGKMAAAQGRMSLPALRKAYVAAADCEYDIKSGRVKAEMAVEQLLYAVSAMFDQG
ncbi:MAG TPA: DNA polymerase III subunit delta [Candidatus Saccharimonadia bacterium]|nr:DNA polymerase III subunit delta [Candidatus Saccharimonadia bacterium]